MIRAAFPKSERGYFHLTGSGWVRLDRSPFPADRVETWKYEMEREAEDAKEQVCLTKVWSDPKADGDRVANLHKQFGAPVKPARDRNVTLECQV